MSKSEKSSCDIVKKIFDEAPPHLSGADAIEKAVDESKESSGSLKGKEPEQPLQMDVIVAGKKVRLQFSRPTRWLELQPEQAMAMSQALQHCAGLAAQKKLIVVPGKG